MMLQIHTELDILEHRSDASWQMQNESWERQGSFLKCFRHWNPLMNHFLGYPESMKRSISSVHS